MERNNNVPTLLYICILFSIACMDTTQRKHWEFSVVTPSSAKSDRAPNVLRDAGSVLWCFQKHIYKTWGPAATTQGHQIWCIQGLADNIQSLKLSDCHAGRATQLVVRFGLHDRASKQLRNFCEEEIPDEQVRSPSHVLSQQKCKRKWNAACETETNKLIIFFCEVL